MKSKPRSVMKCDLSYSVDSLLLRLGVAGQVDIWKRIDAIIRVKGRVTSNKKYGKYSYITLNGIENSLTVKCPSELSPNVNEDIVFEGMPVLRPSKFSTGLELIIEGTPVAQVTPIENIDKYISIEKTSFLRLAQLIESTPLSSLLIIGSKTGLTDVLSQIDRRSHEHISSLVVRVSSADAIIRAVGNIRNKYSAFAIVRGGDDNSLKIWDDRNFVKLLVDLEMPFYVALGHSHKVLQVSQYADETFSTPSTFGIAINSSINMFVGLLEDKAKAEKLIKKQCEEIAVLQSKDKASVYPIKEWVVIVIMMLFLFFYK